MLFLLNVPHGKGVTKVTAEIPVAKSDHQFTVLIFDTGSFLPSPWKYLRISFLGRKPYLTYFPSNCLVTLVSLAEASFLSCIFAPSVAHVSTLGLFLNLNSLS